mmetsp:Transcript_28420/g.44422  ORF Transcript_28420/g.44422 Transcript_28420/m.44422 type:complete len:107 (+) Transcript_28420:769-1089(+)
MLKATDILDTHGNRFVTEAEAGHAVLRSGAATMEYGGGDVAPPWFAPAMDTALHPLRTNIQEMRTNIQEIRTDIQEIGRILSSVTAATANRKIESKNMLVSWSVPP